ncbi:hypothetical protein KA005_47275 [bacterium]|nr:hypothetical protein [bacterium]
MWVNIVRQVRAFLKKWLWEKPTEETPQKKSDTEIKAKEVQHAYVCIDYKGQLINWKKDKVHEFNSMSRNQKRETANYYAIAVKKGRIKFVEIDGKMICVQNRDYETRARKNSRK